MNVEFLIAWDDNTWSTKVFKLPEELRQNCQTDWNEWVQKHPGAAAPYRGAVLFTVYNENPEEVES